MKLSCFPLIVQQEILDHLSVTNIFFLSLCSKRTKNFIIHSQKFQFEKVKHIDYEIHDKVIRIALKSEPIFDRHRENLLLLFDTPEEFTGITVGFSDAPGVQEIKVNGLETPIVLFRHRSKPHILHVKYCSSNLESTIETIHNHLYDLMGHVTKFRMETSARGESNFLPMLRNIRMLDIHGDGFEPSRIDELLSRSTCLEYFAWTASSDRQIKLREDSKIFELDTVNLHVESLLTKSVMKYFNGRHAFLNGFNATTTDVIQFLNAWKTGEQFGNLEVMGVLCHISIPEILNSVQFKEHETEVQYSYIRNFRALRICSTHLCVFRSKLYMIRESDGHVATVSLSNHTMYIGVWDMTEKEFLEKFQMAD